MAQNHWQYNPNVNMVFERELHQMSLLPNNKVLITGGNVSYNPTDIYQIYDSITNTCDYNPNNKLPNSLIYHTTTTLNNSNVLIVGGNTTNDIVQSNCYLFNSTPNANIIQPTGSLNIPRKNHTAILLPNGNVMVMGGFNTNILNSCEIYNVNNGTWTIINPMNSYRFDHRVVLLNNNKILVVGGFDGNSYSNTTEIYDIASGTWSSGPNFGNSNESGAVNHSCTLLANGDVLITGGQNYDYNVIHNQCYLYNPTQNLIKSVTPMNYQRASHTATLLDDGKVLIVGGDNQAITCELFDPNTETWTMFDSLNVFRINHTTIKLPNGDILVLGGRNNTWEVLPNDNYKDKLNSNLLLMSKYNMTKQTLKFGVKYSDNYPKINQTQYQQFSKLLVNKSN